jgi:tRNA modification GTPase
MNDERPTSAWTSVLTPPGRGAVAVVRVWGADAVRVATAAFRPNRPARLSDTPCGRLRVGRMGNGLGDEVVAVRLDGETADVEVHCHGGAAPLELVLTALEAQGAPRREPTEWAAHVHRSPLSAQAVIDLAQAPTIRTAEILIDQLQGALETEIQRVLDKVSSDTQAAVDAVDTLIARSAVGLRLIAGWHVVLTGRPNVGKSRLMNALAGFDRAIVDPAPGTTRDVVTERTAIDGWPIELADTAGIRESNNAVEASGVALARAQLAKADLVLLVLDRSEPLSEADRILVANNQRALWVTNKADLPAAWEPRGSRALVVSAERGDGLEGLMAAISSRLVPDQPPAHAAVPFRQKHVRLLGHARTRLASGRVHDAAKTLELLLGQKAP